MNDVFYERYKQIRDRAFEFSNIERLCSFLPLKEFIDQEKLKAGDIFEFGFQLGIDMFLASDAEYINLSTEDTEIIGRILFNLIEREKDPAEKLLKQIQREAVIGIFGHTSTEVLCEILNSLTDRTLKEEKCNPYSKEYYRKYIKVKSILERMGKEEREHIQRELASGDIDEGANYYYY